MKNNIILHGQLTDFIDYNNLIKAQASAICYNPSYMKSSSAKKVVSSKRKYKRNKRKTRRLK